MFRVNRRTDYAIRVMLALAKNQGTKRLSTKDIQQSMLVPKAFLQRIIADLSKAELIQTFPGPHGGIQLSQTADKINLRNVWEAIEGPVVISGCLEEPEGCPLNPSCPVSAHWASMQQYLVRELEETTLSKLVGEVYGIQP